MKTRVYLKQGKTAMTMFIACTSEIFQGKRYYDGYQYNTRTKKWMEWDMAETRIGKLVRNGLMVRIQ